MRLVQFYALHDQERKRQIGRVEGETTVVALQTEDSMRALIRNGNVQSLKEGARYRLEDVKLLCPLTDPEKIICIGLNYHDHVIESNMQVPKVPVLFPKYNNSLVGHDDEVTIPAEVAQCDYEVELAVVIGRTASKVEQADAMNYVFGYTVLNDVSARDIQLNEPQWTRGKAIDGFAPVGPWIVTADELPDPGNLGISLTLNGEQMQQSSTRELIFDIPYLISFLSRTITLQAGDIISTGTPPGVGMGRNPQVWLQPGDVVEASVEGIGTLRNVFVAEKL